MVEKVITKVSFVGEGYAGRLAYPGEVVDVDAKTGALAPAGSTPIGNLTNEQLQAEIDRREANDGETKPVFGSNVADANDTNTGAQPLVMAPIRPGSGPEPQGLPPGTVPHGDSFIRPAPSEANAAVEVVLGTGADVAALTGAPAASDKPLGSQNKAELLETAKARGIEVDEGATKADILDKLDGASNA
ncbi:hypothetical protein [Sphingomonas sp. URHD0057]|uniref:hypothetical protein n=1 Tax=Sphingomonas sp. URHD0057 TaxID=1380389 RepID=UPI00049136E2|nr:hypothetical protein [Sphingomonas sp. URHD0057]